MPPRRTAGSRAALLAWAALASAALAFGVLQLSPTGLDPLTHAVSEWGLGPYAWGYRWFTVSLAVAGAALAVAVPAVLVRRRGPAQVLLVLFALARSVVGWVPMDAPGAAATTTGLWHWALGTVTFVSFVVLAFMLGARSVLPGPGQAVGRSLTGLGLVGAVCVLEMSAATRVPALMTMFGLVERLDYLAMAVGLAMLAALASGARRGATPSDA